MPKQLKIISERCIGCKSCELSCSLANEEKLNPSRSRITVLCFKEGKYNLPYNMPFTCRQCADAPCLKSCPVDAITQQKNEMKVVIVNQERCIGCGKCINACPFGAMLFNKMAKKAYKCELCGGTPACAAICPVEAILFMNQKPFYSKGTALEMEGFTILSQRQKGSIRQPPKSSR